MLRVIVYRDQLLRAFFQFLSVPWIRETFNGVSRIFLAPYYAVRNRVILRRAFQRVRDARARGKAIVFFSVSSPTDIQFVEGLIQRLSAMPQLEVLIFSGKPHLAVETIQSRLRDVEVYPYGLLPFFRADLLITTSTWLGWCRPYGTRVAHVLHSLASLQIYPDGTFDDFDIIFAKGPHHAREFQQYYSVRCNAAIPICAVGCERVDRLYQRRTSLGKAPSKIERVTFAPTFGEGLALHRQGEAIVSQLLALNISVTLRPHVISFQESGEVIRRIMKRFGGHPKFSLDEPSNVSDLSPDCDLVITDWSGAALEFALAYERPVLFVEGPRKIYNANWKKYFSDEGVQVEYRERLGRIIQTPGEIPEALKRIEQGYQGYIERIRAAVPELLFHRGESIEKAVSCTLELVMRTKTISDPAYQAHTQAAP